MTSPFCVCLAILCLSGHFVIEQKTDVNQTETFSFKTRKNRLWAGGDHLVEDRSDSGCQFNFYV